MTVNTTAPKQQMLRLLDKLANDDLFRGRFERDPKAVLLEAGFSTGLVAAFPAVQLEPGRLAAKSVFAADRLRVANDLAEECMCMIIPQPQLGPSRKRQLSNRLSQAA